MNSEQCWIDIKKGGVRQISLGFNLCGSQRLLSDLCVEKKLKRRERREKESGEPLRKTKDRKFVVHPKKVYLRLLKQI